jgi:HAD superfamily hydrolase (TIGR01549 family)
MIKGIIFDYDGTIADSIHIKTVAFADLYRTYGEKIVNKVINFHLKNGGMSRFEKFKYYHKNFLNIDLLPEKIEELSNKFSEIVTTKVAKAPYVSGALEFISSNKNYKMFISTATPQDEIITILNIKKTIKYFDIVLGSPKSKSEHIKIIINKSKLRNNELVYVGDSFSDKEAAEENNVYFIGLDSEKKFEKKTLIMKDFRKLLVLINRINNYKIYE